MSPLFFFSSRRRHTRYIGDWSSDVCSSDLRPEVVGDTVALALPGLGHRVAHEDPGGARAFHRLGHPRDDERGEETRVEASGTEDERVGIRSEERRVGKEWGARAWSWGETKD